MHQTAALLLCIALVATCTLLTKGTRRGGGGSVGINFARRYCCYRNLDGSYSEDHQDAGLGRDTARASLRTRGQKVLYARSATIPRAAQVPDSSRGVCNTSRLYATAVRFVCPLKMIYSLILRGISPTWGSECVRMVILDQSSAFSQGCIGVWPSVVRHLEALLCSGMLQDASGTHQSYNSGRTDAHGHYSDRG